MKSIRVKSAFTLMELLVVVLIISLVYFVFFTNFNFSSKKVEDLKLENIKEFLLKNFKYEHSLSFVCIDKKDLPCYVRVDGKLNNKFEVKGLFEQLPKVYTLNSDFDELEFNDTKVNNNSYDTFLKLYINKDLKHKNLVVELSSDKIYVFKSLEKKAEIYKDLDQLKDKIYEREIEVRDAF